MHLRALREISRRRAHTARQLFLKAIRCSEIRTQKVPEFRIPKIEIALIIENVRVIKFSLIGQGRLLYRSGCANVLLYEGRI
jgi:hypothetical protein